MDTQHHLCAAQGTAVCRATQNETHCEVELKPKLVDLYDYFVDASQVVGHAVQGSVYP